MHLYALKACFAALDSVFFVIIGFKNFMKGGKMSKDSDKKSQIYLSTSDGSILVTDAELQKAKKAIESELKNKPQKPSDKQAENKPQQ